jgi:hypothetical protein
VAVAGYDVSIASYGNRVAAAWLSATGLRLPNADEVSFTLIDEDESPTRVATQAHGTPGTPLLIDAKGLLFGCQKRLCSLGSYSSTPKITNGAILNDVKDSAILTVNKVRYAVTSISKKLVLVKL